MASHNFLGSGFLHPTRVVDKITVGVITEEIQ